MDANIMQIDEIRFEEDLPALGLNWIKLGLEDVLYDPKTNTVYTPNTNQTAVMGKLQLGGAKETEETPLQERANGGMIEDRGVDYIQGPDGKMQGSRPSGRGRVAKGEPRYVPSPQRNKGGIQISAKKYGKLCGIMNTYHPNAESGDKVSLRDVKLTYHVTADGNGGFTVDRITRNKARRR